jgi:Tol biopolymer transport system component
MVRRFFFAAVVSAAAALVLLPKSARAQYPFGKNKVNYATRDWKVLQTEHVDIYYYPNERNLVSFIAPLVEDTYLEYSKLFRLEFRGRLPLVMYSSHYDFQQTNIVPSLISDYTGGFTDLVKGRIAVPMTGSMWELRHVVRHEMVHAFMMEKLAKVMSEKNRFTYQHPPLWFVEGMAEYIASPKADTQSHMFVRDALLQGNLPDLETIWRIEGSFMMYKEGEAVLRYIATNFGTDAIVRILENWWVSDKFPIVLKRTIGMNLNELSDAFMKSIKRRYYPTILHAGFAPDDGKQLTEEHTFHSRPAVGYDKDGHLAVYSLCAEDGVIAICSLTKDARGRLVQRSLIEGARSASFESIPAFRSKIEVHGQRLLFVSKRQERDAIYLWDLARNREIDHFTFHGLSVISSPTQSSDGDKIVFSAIDTTGSMDLYLYRIGEKRLQRLTHDKYTEEDPDYHPTRDVVLFASDRCEGGVHEQQGIYQIDIESGEITAMTCGDYSDTQPEWSANGSSFLFTSDRDGIFNIYLYDVDRHVIVRQTSVIGGLTTAAFFPDQTAFVATGYYRGEFHLFEFPVQREESAGEVAAAAEVDSSTASWLSEPPKEYNFVTQDYKMKLGLDFAGTGLAIDPDFGSLGNGGEVVLSDILGNNQYYIFFGNSSQETDNFFKRLNVGVNYVNLSHRLNYSIGVFHLTSQIGDFFSLFRSERRYGVAAGLSYPFSKFSRADGSVVIRRVDRDVDFSGLEDQRSFLGSAFLTYVVDNTLWTIGGPLKGWRYFVTGGHTVDFQGRGFDNSTLQFDIRKYFKVTDRIVIAERFITRNSYGSDFQIFYLGGPWDLRGYDFREFFGRSTYLINNELRFPLIDRFALSFPFGTLETPLIRGSLFFDAGKVTRFIADTDWLGSMGLGTELNLGYAPVIRVNFTRKTDFTTISKSTELELFIGFNY